MPFCRDAYVSQVLIGIEINITQPRPDRGMPLRFSAWEFECSQAPTPPQMRGLPSARRVVEGLGDEMSSGSSITIWQARRWRIDESLPDICSEPHGWCPCKVSVEDAGMSDLWHVSVFRCLYSWCTSAGPLVRLPHVGGCTPGLSDSGSSSSAEIRGGAPCLFVPLSASLRHPVWSSVTAALAD